MKLAFVRRLSNIRTNLRYFSYESDWVASDVCNGTGIGNSHPNSWFVGAVGTVCTVAYGKISSDFTSNWLWSHFMREYLNIIHSNMQDYLSFEADVVNDGHEKNALLIAVGQQTTAKDSVLWKSSTASSFIHVSKFIVAAVKLFTKVAIIYLPPNHPWCRTFRFFSN